MRDSDRRGWSEIYRAHAGRLGAHLEVSTVDRPATTTRTTYPVTWHVLTVGIAAARLYRRPDRPMGIVQELEFEFLDAVGVMPAKS